jgi:hypothetical protein
MLSLFAFIQSHGIIMLAWELTFLDVEKVCANFIQMITKYLSALQCIILLVLSLTWFVLFLGIFCYVHETPRELTVVPFNCNVPYWIALIYFTDISLLMFQKTSVWMTRVCIPDSVQHPTVIFNVTARAITPDVSVKVSCDWKSNLIEGS